MYIHAHIAEQPYTAKSFLLRFGYEYDPVCLPNTMNVFVCACVFVYRSVRT